MEFALEAIVANVDLRLPQKPAPLFFLGGTPIDAEIIAAIRRSIGEGEIISVAGEEHPRYTIFFSRPDGRIDSAVFAGVEQCFRKYGTEACVFEYMGIEKIFRLRPHEYFVVERIAK